MSQAVVTLSTNRSASASVPTTMVVGTRGEAVPVPLHCDPCFDHKSSVHPGFFQPARRFSVGSIVMKTPGAFKGPARGCLRESQVMVIAHVLHIHTLGPPPNFSHSRFGGEGHVYA